MTLSRITQKPYVRLCAILGTLAIALSAVAADCSFNCVQNMVCLGTDDPCPGCDPGVGVACSDYIAEDYNNNATIFRKEPGGTKEATKSANPVQCFKTAPCVNGQGHDFFACTAGVCRFIPPATLFTYCIECSQGAWVPSNVYDYTCSSQNCD